MSGLPPALRHIQAALRTGVGSSGRFTFIITYVLIERQRERAR